MAANDFAAQNGTEKLSTNALTTVNGTTVTADVIEVQRIKVGFGSDGALRDVDASNGLPVSGSFFQATQPVSGAFFQATQPVSAASLPLPTGAATEATLALVSGTDITTPSPAMPAGGVGIRGWLSAIWTKLNASLAVTGTFWQATQPISMATNTPDVTDRSARLLGTIANTAFTANAGANLNTSALALDATLTGGLLKAIARGGAKGTTVAGDITSNPVDANTQAIHVNLAGVNAVNATLGAETTKVIGTVNIAASQTVGLVAGAASIGTVVLTAETTKVIGTVNLSAAQTLATVTNLAQMGGVAISLNTGVRDTGTQRVTIATNDLVPVTGTITAVTAITNALPTGANTIGAVNIAAAQTLATVTTVAAVTAITNALPTGANVIGALTANQSVNTALIAGVAPTLNTGVVTTGTQRVTLATDIALPALSEMRAATLHVTATAAANTAATASLPAAGAGLFHYITSIHLMRNATAAVVGSATLIHTSANLPGSPAWSVGNAMAAGGTQLDLDYKPATSLKSSVANTITSVTMPAGGLAVLNRVNISYFTAP